jgi:hypothetical protein
MALQYELNPDGVSYNVKFGSCTAGEVIIPTGYNNLPVTKIGNGAFNGCASITNVIMQSGINIIDNYAFNFCPLLTGVTFPSTLTSIGYSSFANTPLKTIDFPTINPLTIGSAAFYGSTGFKIVDIPSNVNSIDPTSFARCQSLTGFNVNKNNPYYTGISGVLFTKNLARLYCFPQGKNDSFYTFPPQTSEIGAYAFSILSNLSGISVNNLSYIGDNAFEFCPLTGIDLPNTLTYVGSRAFNVCTKIKNIVFPSGISFLNFDIFNQCTNLTGITIPEGITEIRSNAFTNTYSLKNISLPNSLNSLGYQTFAGSALTGITIPDATKIFGTYVFFDCTGLTSVKFGTGMSYIGDNMFLQCYNLSNLSSFYNITGILSAAFQSCRNLNKVFFNKNIKNISANAFANCTNLVGAYFDGDAPNATANSFINTSGIFKAYRKKNFVTGWSGQLGGKPVVLWSDNVIKSGGIGKLTTKKRN